MGRCTDRCSIVKIRLLANDRSIYDFELSGIYRGAAPGSGRPPYVRKVFAAAHVVADARADCDPWIDAAIDWDATLAFRHHLWSHGFAVAEAMDTAQRGMGLGWDQAHELIRRTAADARCVPGAEIGCGVGTDHLPPGATIEEVINGYLMQAEAVEAAGGQLIVMASRALAAAARSPEDYAQVYEAILSQTREPVVLHWLGPMFDPALAGYWGSDSVDVAMASCLSVIRDHADKIDGIKVSMLDAALEIEMRRKLPSGVRMYTGDDFNFPELIAGDAEGHSDALLGIFDAIAPVAAAALTAQAQGDVTGFLDLLRPTERLSRHIFKAPTRFYKTGIVFLSYINGHQDHFTMIGGQQSARSIAHLCELFRLTDAAGLLVDPEDAIARFRPVLAASGIA